MKPHRSCIEHQTHDVGERAWPQTAGPSQMHYVPEFAIDPLALQSVGRHRSISTIDTTAATPEDIVCESDFDDSNEHTAF